MSGKLTLVVTSPSFEDFGRIPKRHTGFAEDSSPEFQVSNIASQAVSLAVIMEDLDIPFTKAFPHWLIWNIPVMETIPERIPHGATVPSLGGARQGIAYGVHRYRGPKPPIFIRGPHRYRFFFYALDCLLELDSAGRKRELLQAMEGHILQRGHITGTYRR